MSSRPSDLCVVDARTLRFGGKTYRCSVGSNGFTSRHREGDNATPAGRFPLRECWYRADRIATPSTSLRLRKIMPDDGWCDDPAHPEYNRHVKLPFAASHETLWRDDAVYDVIIPIGFNDNPVIPGVGSAIFLHLARPDYVPTHGCIALSLASLLEILIELDTRSHIAIALF